MLTRCGVGIQRSLLPKLRSFTLRRMKTTTEAVLCGKELFSSPSRIFQRFEPSFDAACRTSASMGSWSPFHAHLRLRIILRVEGPHFRTRESVGDELYPSSFLWARFVSRETQQTNTKPTYMMAPISGTVGRSEITLKPFFCFIHSFHLSGRGDDTWMTRSALLESWTFSIERVKCRAVMK